MNVREIAGRKEVRAALGILAAVLALEILVFNYRHWGSLGCREITDYQVSFSEGLIPQEDGSFLTGEGGKSIEFSGIDRELNTLYLRIEQLDRSPKEQGAVTLYQAARDISHEDYYGLPDREHVYDQERSQYHTYHLYGDCRSLRVTMELGEGRRIRLEYGLNRVIPFFFSVWRVLVLWGIGFLVYIFRPASRLYRVPFLEMGSGKTAAMAIFLLLNFLALYQISGLNPFFRVESIEHQKEYQNLAHAFSQGQLALLEEPSQALQEMDNPYDYASRARVMQETGSSFLWDHAYYEGKYYVYFGVAPELLFYLPYYLLTGEDLRNRTVVMLGVLMFLAGFLGVFDQLIRRWFPRISLGAWCLLSELAVLGSGLIYISKRPDMYTVPISVGMGLGFLGVWCLLSADGGEGPKLRRTALGSLLTALVAGCRPQLFLIFLLPVIVLHRRIFTKRLVTDREGRRWFFAAAVPMLAVAALLMWYNWARFGSVFDFGSNYNLNFNDMRYRGWVWDRIPLGIWAYLLAPLKATITFPFAEANYFASNYMGVTISEATYGGLFAVSPFVWLCPALILLRKRAAGGTARSLSFACMGIGLVILCVDTQMAGILMRYFGDFRIFFMLAAVLAWLLLFEGIKSDEWRGWMYRFLIFCLLWEGVYQLRIFSLDTGEALMNLRPELFYWMKYQVMFWL